MMQKTLLAFTLASVLAGCAATGTAPQAKDAALKRIQTLQAKADEYAASRKGAAAYAPQKALAWLDMAQDEYYEDDRTGIVVAATDEAERILRQIESGKGEPPFATPVLPGSEKVRDDLWVKAAELKTSPHFGCAAKQLALLDVQLVWTGHEYWESGLSHAKTHSEVADNLAYDAEMQIRQCSVAVPGSSQGKTAAGAAAAAAEKYSLATDAPFAFDRAGVDQIISGGRIQLDALLARLKSRKQLTHIDVVGYTDATGTPAYNLALSMRRAQNVRDYLIAHGVPAERVSASGRGAANPVAYCNAQAKPAIRSACEQANRRVEISLSGKQ